MHLLCGAQSTERITGVMHCPLCAGPHGYRLCISFLSLKLQASKQQYSSRRLQPIDESAFMAAGILLRDKAGKVLMIKEKRKGTEEARYNFVGGKRDCRLGWFRSLRLETSFETASAEFGEEIGHCLPTRKFQSVYWFPKSKYVLYSIEGELAVTSDRAHWFSRAEIIDGLRAGDVFHKHIEPQLRFIL